MVDLFEDTNVSDTALARTSDIDYLSMRWKSFSKPQLSDSERASIGEVIFKTIPQIVSSVYRWSAIHLFNEHYIVKLPHGPELFRWHSDAAEQLMMFPAPGMLSMSPYVSVWAPLDPCTETNGTLRVSYNTAVHRIDASSLSAGLHEIPTPVLNHVVSMEELGTGPNAEVGDVGEDDEEGSKGGVERGRALEVPAGSMVLFSYDLLHCSGRNFSEAHRRVFYAQYSQAPITVTAPPPLDKTPLNFAIPCAQAHTLCGGNGATDTAPCPLDLQNSLKRKR